MCGLLKSSKGYLCKCSVWLFASFLLQAPDISLGLVVQLHSSLRVPSICNSIL